MKGKNSGQINLVWGMNISVVLWFVFLTVKTMGLFISKLAGHELQGGYCKGNGHGLDIDFILEQFQFIWWYKTNIQNTFMLVKWSHML